MRCREQGKALPTSFQTATSPARAARPSSLLTRQPRLLVDCEQALQRWQQLALRQVKQGQGGTHADACREVPQGGEGDWWGRGAGSAVRRCCCNKPWPDRVALLG